MVQPMHQSESILPWWILWEIIKLSKAGNLRHDKLLRGSSLSYRKDRFNKQKGCNFGEFIQRTEISLDWTWDARVYKFQQESNHIHACDALQNSRFRRKKQKALRWTERVNLFWSVCENEEASILSGSDIALKRKENHRRHTEWVLWGSYFV